MRRLAHRVSLAALALGGCLPDPAELVITVDSSMAVPCNIDALTIEVTAAGATETRTLDLDAVALPGSLSVIARELNTETASIEVTGLLGGAAVSIARGEATFEPGEIQTVAFELDESCTADAPCGAEVSAGFAGLPAAIARRDCVSAYEVRPTVLGFLNACDLAEDVQGSTLPSENEIEVESPLDPELPFTFYFYNDAVTDLWIGDNGYITFGADPPMARVEDIGDPRNLGEPGFPGPGVTPFWDKLITNDRGVCLAVTGSAPDRLLWVSWDQACFEGVPADDCGDLDFGSLTFTVALEESTDRIYVGFPEMTGTGTAAARARGLTAVIGLVADESLGKGCPATECAATGLCDDGTPCNYTQFSAFTDLGELTPLEFVPR